VLSQGQFSFGAGNLKRKNRLLAVSFDADCTPFGILLPSFEKVLVGSVLREPQGSCARVSTDIVLHPTSAFDPAIVYALPSLIIDRKAPERNLG
jgi:hypothetical protein